MPSKVPESKQQQSLIAPLQLENYVVDDLSFKSNSATRPKGSKTVPPTITLDFDVKSHAKDTERFLILMEIDLNKGQMLTEFQQYQVHLHLVGWFRFNKGLDSATKHKMILTNGSSILYGIGRGIVAQITGSLGQERFILPSLNLLAAVQEKLRPASAPQKPKRLALKK